MSESLPPLHMRGFWECLLDAWGKDGLSGVPFANRGRPTPLQRDLVDTFFAWWLVLTGSIS